LEKPYSARIFCLEFWSTKNSDRREGLFNESKMNKKPYDFLSDDPKPIDFP
jgi:hypothetical protein